MRNAEDRTRKTEYGMPVVHCHPMLATLVSLLLLTQSTAVPPQYAPANADWNRPLPPFRIVGNLYYVGASDVSAYLFTTPEGLILLDTGFRETVPLVETSLAKLGFRLQDVRLLLTSHGHFDHAGGVAGIKARTKARFLTSPAEAPLLAAGGKGDFAFGDKASFPAVHADGLLHDGEQVRLGGVTLVAHFTPGHTKGCTTWTTEVAEGGRSYRVVIPCSLSAPGYQLVNNASYPGIVSDFEATITKLRSLPCDIFLGGHSWDFDLHGKLRARAKGASENPFVDPAGYRRYLDRAEAALRKQMEGQKGRAPQPANRPPGTAQDLRDEIVAMSGPGFRTARLSLLRD